MIPRLAVDLKNELSEKGFYPANLTRMVRFWSEYPGLSVIGARPVRQMGAEDFSPWDSKSEKAIIAPSVRQFLDSNVDGPEELVFLQLSWSHNVILLQKLADLPTRLWYARQTLEQGWSRDTLINCVMHRTTSRSRTIAGFCGG